MDRLPEDTIGLKIEARIASGDRMGFDAEISCDVKRVRQSDQTVGGHARGIDDQSQIGDAVGQTTQVARNDLGISNNPKFIRIDRPGELIGMYRDGALGCFIARYQRVRGAGSDFEGLQCCRRDVGLKDIRKGGSDRTCVRDQGDTVGPYVGRIHSGVGIEDIPSGYCMKDVCVEVAESNVTLG